ncbi:Tb-291 membrane-associated protein, partial [Danaus plexippus plexippus]
MRDILKSQVHVPSSD